QDVEWLGWEPAATTYSSDSFGKLHQMAIKLIKNGKAYVCHQTKADITRCRDVAKARALDPASHDESELYSPYRER
ncbi:unnamed protein product, partial [Discosporangium mesarthrocarpum]